MREDNNTDINDKNERIALLSNDNNGDKYLNGIEYLLEEGGNDCINDEADKKIFDNSLKLSNKKFSSKTLPESYEKNIPFVPLTKKIIKKGTTKRTLFIMKNIILTLFQIVNLTAIIEYIKMFNTIFDVVYYSVKIKWVDKNPDEIEKFSIEDFNKNYNFFMMFFEESLKNIFSFGLILPTSFIGTFFLNKMGFRFSFIILNIINLAAFLLIIKAFPFLDYYDFNNTYPNSYILFLFIICFLLLVGAGATAMLSQQLIMDKIDKCNEYYINLTKEELNKKEDLKKNKNQENQIIEESDDGLISFETPLFQENEDENEEINVDTYYPDVSVSNLQNSTNYDENVAENSNINTITITQNENERIDEIINLNEKNHDIDKGKIDGNKCDNLTRYIIITLFAFIFPFLINHYFLGKIEKNIVEYMAIAKCNKNYNCFRSVIKDRKLSITKKELFDKLILRIYEDSRRNFIYIYIICGISNVISLILYSIFDSIFTKEKKDENASGVELKTNIYEFLGEMHFSQEISLKNNIELCKKIFNVLRIPFIILINFLITIINSIIRFLYAILPLEEIFKKKYQIHYICKEVFKKVKSKLYIIYQRKSQLFHIDKLVTGKAAKTISDYMMMYLYIQFMCLSFENEYLKLQNKKELLDDSSKLGEIHLSEKSEFFDISFEKSDNKNNNNNIPNLGNNLLLKTEENYILLTFAIVFILFIESTRVGNAIRKFCGEKRKINNIKEGDTNANNESVKEEDKKKELSTGILGGIFTIFYVEGIYLIIVYFIYLFYSEKEIFKKVYLYFAPSLMNQFYQFNMIYYCARYSVNINKYEIINSSCLIPFLLTIIKIFIFYIKNYFDLEKYLLQFILLALPIIGILTNFYKNRHLMTCKNVKEIAYIFYHNLIIGNSIEWCRSHLRNCFLNCSGSNKLENLD